MGLDCVFVAVKYYRRAHRVRYECTTLSIGSTYVRLGDVPASERGLGVICYLLPMLLQRRVQNCVNTVTTANRTELC